MEEVLSSANAIAGDYYQERQRLVAAQARRLARTLAHVDLRVTPVDEVRKLVAPEVVAERSALIEVYGVEAGGDAARQVISLVDIASPALPRDYARSSADRLAERTVNGAIEEAIVEPLSNGGELIRSAVPIRRAADEPIAGVVIASEYLDAQLAARARRMTEAYEGYQQLRFFRTPITVVYLSFFLMLTLMILVAATWVGLYLAKRITRAVQLRADRGRVRLPDRSLQSDGGRLVGQPPASGTLLVRARAQAPRRRGTAAVSRDHSRADCHGRRVGGRCGPYRHRQRRRCAAARPRWRRVRHAGCDRFRLGGAQTAGHAHRRCVPQP
jgi:hypothetical protein